MSITTHLMTAEELMNLSDDGHRHELVKGVLLTMSASGADHGLVAMNVSVFLTNYIKANDLGVAFAAETGFKLESDPDTVLAPAFSFIKKERNPPRSTSYLEMVPDLVVEVNSSSKSRPYVERKAAQWLSFGVQSVWLINCQHRVVEVISREGTRTVFTESDELIDSGVLPGFRVQVAEIFN